MSHDDFESERYRVERVLEILEHAAARLEARIHISLSVLRDAVAFVRATEDAALEAARLDETEPAVSCCLEQHAAASQPLTAMHDAFRSLEAGDASAARRFARHAREYVELRYTHLRRNAGLFRAALTRPQEAHAHLECVEPVDTRRLWIRLVEAAAILDIAAPTAFSRLRMRRLGAR